MRFGFDREKMIVFKILEKLSAFQLPELKYYGKNRQDGCFLPREKSHLYTAEIKKFEEYRNKFSKTDRQFFESDDEYRSYILFTQKHAVKCNKNCGYLVCPWCHHCKADHWKDSCSDEKRQLVKLHHGTWRQYFMEHSKILYDHEWAIRRSYVDPIISSLYTMDCPCYAVLYHESYTEQDMIEDLKHYDSRQITLNMELVNNLVNK